MMGTRRITFLDVEPDDMILACRAVMYLLLTTLASRRSLPTATNPLRSFMSIKTSAGITVRQQKIVALTTGTSTAK